jgi:protein O-GlcNAc transferase
MLNLSLPLQMQVRNLERAYFKMWNIHCSGQQPHHFKVAENDFDCPYDR